MKKLLAIAAVAAAFAGVAPAQAYDHRTICNEQSCAGIPRCYYWSDYPTCIYPWPIVP